MLITKVSKRGFMMVVLCAHRAWSNGGLLETTEHFNFQSLPSLLSGFMLIIFYPF